MNSISKKKPFVPVRPFLKKYLIEYGRWESLPVLYKDLLDYEQSFPVSDLSGNDTLWETVMFKPEKQEELNRELTRVYSLLKTDGDTQIEKHLFVDRIDYCSFGNSNPFRVRMVNKFNDNHDYIYIKMIDASRIYGLELEHILSPNRINYMVAENTIVEEHIAGIPGDDYIKHHLSSPTINRVRLAKEFVKFNERCFVRLLGDMRSYNYVVDVTPDFDNEQYRIRAIDFDQQCYEGKRTIYLPQYFKENNALVEMCIDLLNHDTVRQYQNEERTLIARRLKQYRYQLKALVDCMRADNISTDAHVELLKSELTEHYKDKRFSECENMGELLRLNLYKTLAKVI